MQVFVVMQGPQCPLQNRILFHCAHKSGQEERLMECHAQLTDSLEDQLSLASIHYLRGHYQVLQPSKAVVSLGAASRSNMRDVGRLYRFSVVDMHAHTS